MNISNVIDYVIHAQEYVYLWWLFVGLIVGTIFGAFIMAIIRAGLDWWEEKADCEKCPWKRGHEKK